MENEKKDAKTNRQIARSAVRSAEKLRKSSRNVRTGLGMDFSDRTVCRSRESRGLHGCFAAK